MAIGPISARIHTVSTSEPEPVKPAPDAAAPQQHAAGHEHAGKLQAREGMRHIESDRRAHTSVSQPLDRPRPSDDHVAERGAHEADRKPEHTSVSKSLDRRVDELHHVERD